VRNSNDLIMRSVSVAFVFGSARFVSTSEISPEPESAFVDMVERERIEQARVCGRQSQLFLAARAHGQRHQAGRTSAQSQACIGEVYEIILKLS
jgi:hypothetical protein